MGLIEDASDADLLARCAGDGAAFSVLYRRYERAVLAYLGRRVRDPQLAADLAAETFAAVLVGAAGYRARGESAAPWVFGIARNVLGASLRAGRVESSARRRLGMREPLVVTDEDLERVEQLAGSGTPLLGLLARLPDAQRQALEARVLEELPYRAVAERLECSELLARQRVSRGLSNLRKLLEAHR